MKSVVYKSASDSDVVATTLAWPSPSSWILSFSIPSRSSVRKMPSAMTKNGRRAQIPIERRPISLRSPYRSCGAHVKIFWTARKKPGVGWDRDGERERRDEILSFFNPE